MCDVLYILQTIMIYLIHICKKETRSSFAQRNKKIPLSAHFWMLTPRAATAISDILACCLSIWIDHGVYDEVVRKAVQRKLVSQPSQVSKRTLVIVSNDVLAFPVTKYKQ